MRKARKPTTMSLENARAIDIEAFYTRYGPMVLRRCRRLLGEEQAAYDATQEVFLRVLTKQDRLTNDHPSALLYRIATNTCLNRIREDRRRNLHGRSPWPVDLATGPLQEGRVSAGDLLDRLFDDGQDETRLIAVMYFIDGMTLKEIGQAIDKSVSAVHKRLNKLRRRVRIAGGMA